MQRDLASCTFCDKYFSGIECYRQHIESAKHKKKVQLHNLNSGDQLMPELLKCEICDVCCSGYIPYEQHLRSEKHSKKLRMKTFMATTAENYMCGLSSFPEDTILRHQYNCPTKSDRMIKNSDTVHVVPSGQISDKNVMLFSDKSSFYCSICDKKINDPISYQLHLHSNIHRSLKEKEKDESCISPGVPIDVSNQSKMDFPSIKKGENSNCSEMGDHLFCSLCNMHFTGSAYAEQHYKDKNHIKALSRKSEMNDLIPKTECFSDTSNRVINFCNYEGIAERDFQKKVTVIYEDEPFKL